MKENVEIRKAERQDVPLLLEFIRGNAQERFVVHLFVVSLLCYFHFLAIHEQSMAVGFNM